MIRPYRPTDLDALYEVCLRTGAAGEDASELTDDPKLLGELYAAPYGLFEPESAFVAEDGEGVGGYVLGALDTRAFHDRLESEWFPALRARYPLVEGGRRFDDLFIHLVHHPHRAPDEILDRYPSHLHIDLLPRLQGRGLGRRLMATLLDSLRERGSTGVHFGVSAANPKALGFYRHLGFEELSGDGTVIVFARTL